VLLLGIFFLFWVYRRSAISTNYIKSMYAAAHEDELDEDADPTGSEEQRPPSIEVKTKEEWSGEKESAKEVWLDVPTSV